MDMNVRPFSPSSGLQFVVDRQWFLDVLMDDCWHASTRDPDTGAPRADPQKFPTGIKALSEEIHALGLKVKTVQSHTHNP